MTNNAEWPIVVRRILQQYRETLWDLALDNIFSADRRYDRFGKIHRGVAGVRQN